MPTHAKVRTLGFGVFEQHEQAVNEVSAVERVAANACMAYETRARHMHHEVETSVDDKIKARNAPDAQGLAEARGRGLMHRFVRQRARARHNACAHEVMFFFFGT